MLFVITWATLVSKVYDIWCWEEREALRSLIDACLGQQGVIGVRWLIGESREKEQIGEQKCNWECTCGREGEQCGQMRPPLWLSQCDQVALWGGALVVPPFPPPHQHLRSHFFCSRTGKVECNRLSCTGTNAIMWYHLLAPKAPLVLTPSDASGDAGNLRGFSSVCILFSPPFALSSLSCLLMTQSHFILWPVWLIGCMYTVHTSQW